MRTFGVEALSSLKSLALISVALTGLGCQKAKMTHTQPVHEAVVIQDENRRPVVEPVAPRPEVTLPLAPRHPEAPPTRQEPVVTRIVIGPDRPQATTIEYTDINYEGPSRVIYDCAQDCPAPQTAAPAPRPQPQPAAPAPQVAAPAPQPAPAPAPQEPSVQVSAPQPQYEQVCYASDFYQPSPEKVDLLVVVDTAGANFDRTDLLGKALAAYVERHTLRDRHVRLGMIPAHGATSPYSGRLFQPLPTSTSRAQDVADLDLDSMEGLSAEARAFIENGNPQVRDGDAANPLVLDSLELDLTNNNFEWYARTNMDFMPEDVNSDGGQSGMYSLYQALTVNFQELRSEGLFREDATQHILFISNEADLCAARFADATPESAQKPMDKQYPDLTREQAARARDCDQTGFQQQDLVARIQELQNNYALTVSSIVPQDRSRFSSLHPFNGKETEVGSGYIEVAQQTGGYLYELFDLTANTLREFSYAVEDQFEEGLTAAYLPSSFRLEYTGELASVQTVVMDEIFDRALLNQNLPAHCLDRSRFDRNCPNMREVRNQVVDNGESLGQGRSSRNVVLEEAGLFGSKVQINYCTSVRL